MQDFDPLGADSSPYDLNRKGINIYDIDGNLPGNVIAAGMSSGGCPDGDCPETIVYGGELDEVVINVYTKDRTWTSEGQRYGFSSGRDQYQTIYPEFAGMSDAQMMTHWGNNYRSHWIGQTEQWDQGERARILMEKSHIFVNGFTTAGAMGMGAFAIGSNLPIPKTFNYTPRISPLKYHPRWSEQLDLFHNFPRSFDNHIINTGRWSQRIIDRANWYELDGAINGRYGTYQIGVNKTNTIFHKNFVPF